ncbi:hypothetical protein EIP91_011033 [Steccherinum ochraceum]|uniref:Uncharacterized protein n=1 Tax=Steccherinum ochraceum TaxID=92696 RepID=A0A4R0R565_9APHY|nr:hypothetical protein EIP91_011033 [Steccherinum ochraceum]
MDASGSFAISNQNMNIDDQLTQLLQGMSLSGAWQSANEEPRPPMPAPKEPDTFMSDSSDSEDSTYNVRLIPHIPASSDSFTPLTPYPIPQPSRSTSPKSLAITPPYCGCGMLQAVQDQLDSDLFPTTSGDYLDIIFAHREVFYAYPQAHAMCALGFTEIAKKVETRQWRADREGDLEAVAAFRNEAWALAST